ncbi:MAG: NACHT domain-containing protein [Burkholderiales bacterium]|nr:NACHT domain-containing protein [Burkholderiales bacterium]
MQENTEKAGGGIPILSWFEGPAKQSINAVFSGMNAKIESLDLFKKYYSHHIGMLREEVSTIKLLGMAQPERLLSLYSPAKVSLTIARRLYAAEWHKADSANGTKKTRDTRGKVKGELVFGDEYIEGNSRIAVLGGPGAGKTTFLKFLALAYSDQQVFRESKLKSSKIPFFVPLPLVAKNRTSIFEHLLNPIQAKTDEYAKDFLTRILNNSHAVVLLDSLDEVPRDVRPEVIEAINDFCKVFPDTKVVVSCRTADYREVLEKFCEVEIAKLELASVEKIVKAWFINDKPKAETLCRLIKQDRSIADLTETPLLLSLLCVQFRHDLSLPKRKAELFRRCTETLLREWDTTRGFRRDSAFEGLTDFNKEKLFDEIAGNFTVSEFAFTFPKAELLKQIRAFNQRVGLLEEDAEGILLEIDQHHGILEQFSQDDYGFSHTSFQEYFAAKHLISKRLERKIVQTKYDNQDWYPIIEFIVALMDDPTEIINFLVDKSSLVGLTNYPPMAKRTTWLHLLYRCLATKPYVEPKVRERAIEHLIESQIEIARIYGMGGVFPIAQYINGGIKHPFLWTTRRPSLTDALAPYRLLSNEILNTPLDGYSDAVFRRISTIDQRLDPISLSDSGQIATDTDKETQERLRRAKKQYLRNSLIANLVTPLARISPNLVIDSLNTLKSEGQWSSNVLKQSIDLIQKDVVQS